MRLLSFVDSHHFHPPIILLQHVLYSTADFGEPSLSNSYILSIDSFVINVRLCHRALQVEAGHSGRMKAFFELGPSGNHKETLLDKLWYVCLSHSVEVA